MKFYIKYLIKKKGSTVSKIKLETIIKDQEMFELISAQKKFRRCCFKSKNKRDLNNLLKQVDKSVINRLKAWE